MKIKKIIILVLVFFLSFNYFQPVSYADASEGGIITAWHEIVGTPPDEIRIHVNIVDYEDQILEDEYRIYIYSEEGVELDHEPDTYWENLDGDSTWITVSSDLDTKWDIFDLGLRYRIELQEQHAGKQDELWMNTPDIEGPFEFKQSWNYNFGVATQEGIASNDNGISFISSFTRIFVAKKEQSTGTFKKSSINEISEWEIDHPGSSDHIGDLFCDSTYLFVPWSNWGGLTQPDIAQCHVYHLSNLKEATGSPFDLKKNDNYLIGASSGAYYDGYYYFSTYWEDPSRVYKFSFDGNGFTYIEDHSLGKTEVQGIEFLNDKCYFIRGHGPPYIDKDYHVYWIDITNWDISNLEKQNLAILSKNENSPYEGITFDTTDDTNCIAFFGFGSSTFEAFENKEYIPPVSIPEIEIGLIWLSNHQNPDGSWGHNVGITSLATLAFLNAGYDENDETVSKAIEYILGFGHVYSDGRIKSGDYALEDTYDTSLAILALVATHNPEYDAIIEKAKNWLINSQWDEDCLWGGINIDDWRYGGFGYGNHSRPDLSNSQFALMALDAAGVPKNDLVWAKTQVFLARCQNRQENVYIPELDYTVEWNPSYNKHDDGGFLYLPGTSFTSNVYSYGSITGAGIWGLKLCGISNSDPRVETALNWVRNHYTWDRNPGMPEDTDSLYYYYLSMSKALVMTIGLNEQVNGHDWYVELIEKLVALQNPDGYWANSNSWFCEDIPELVTSYAILSLQYRQVPPDVKKLSWMTFILHSIADLHVYDPLGRHIGKNYEAGGIDIEIPNSTYEGNGYEQITVPELEAGKYKIVLIGKERGQYELTVQAGVGNETIRNETYIEIINTGETHEVDIDVAMITGLTVIVEEPEEIESTRGTSTEIGNFSLLTDKGNIEEVKAINESDLPSEGKPLSLFPFGFISFNVTGLSPGEIINLTIVLPSNLQGNAQYWKYGPTQDNHEHHWYELPIDSNDGDNIIIIKIQDGGAGDNDMVANGAINDPGGPAIPTVAKSMVNIAPTATVIPCGESFNINLSITSIEPISGVQFNLSYDPFIITANYVEEGNLFQGYSSYFFNGTIDNINGTITDVFGVITTPGGSTISPGVFAEIKFTAKKLDGISPLNLSSVVVGTPGGTPVSIVICHGNVTVVYRTEDINMDGQINILDIITIGQHWDDTGEPCWIPEDINCDGIINILDMILVGQHWTG